MTTMSGPDLGESPIWIAIGAEIRKAISSRVILTTSVLLVVGVGILAGALVYAAENGNQQVLDQLGPVADLTGWPRLVAVVSQIVAAGGVLGFGVALSWMIGREFTDRTISGLFALPVSRSAVVTAKILTYLLWSTAIACLVVLAVGVVGAALDVGPIGGAGAAMIRLPILTVLSAMVAVPAAWASTLGRGPLAGIAVTIGIVVIAQVMVLSGAGAWFPAAAPALWALRPAEVSSIQLALVGLIPLLFGGLAVVAWHRLQLDR